jgi:hypothetical protein
MRRPETPRRFQKVPGRNFSTDPLQRVRKGYAMLYRPSQSSPSIVNRCSRSRGRGRRVRGGEQAAAVRALTAARLHLGTPIPSPTLAAAARMCGTNVTYTTAAITVIESEDEDALKRVRRGEVSLPRAAAQVKNRAALITALRQASPEDRAEAGRVLGVATIFDELVAPNL